MKHIKLTKDKIAFVDNKDFEYLNQWKWCAGKIKNIWYAYRGKRQPKIAKGIYGKVKRISMHRLILKAKKGQYVDHRDDNGLNNQRKNIRICTNSQNICRSRKRKNTSSKYKGVSWSKASNRWLVAIKANKKLIYLGLFYNEKDAAMTYNRAAKKYHKEFARLNIIK